VPVIQPYSPTYQTQVINLILPIQQQEFNVPITIEQQPDLLQIPMFYQVNRGNFWIALDQDRVIGTIALIDIGHHQAVIRKMFVHKDYRGRQSGIAQQLLQTLMSWAKDHAIRELYLGTVDRLKAAQRFYEKNGFIAIHDSELPFNFPRMQVDTRFYTYRLS
jgi:N-acetylglutamate synthase-like GNAT family acetyltransferase